MGRRGVQLGSYLSCLLSFLSANSSVILICHFFWHVFCHLFCHSYLSFLSVILICHFFWHSFCHSFCHSYLAFLLSFLLSFLSGICSVISSVILIWNFFCHYFCHFFCHVFCHFYQSFLLSCLLSFLLSCFPVPSFLPVPSLSGFLLKSNDPNTEGWGKRTIHQSSPRDSPDDFKNLKKSPHIFIIVFCL